MVDVINQEKPTISEGDLKKLIGDYREIQGHNSALADVADMVRKNIRVANLSEKIGTALGAWEVEELKGINQEIADEKVEGIEEELAKQMKEMLEEAEKNPNLVAEKQAEAKKAKKGGKK